jgi:hypothetical protein
VFEVQLTSLINGWGLTHQERCCSRHSNRIGTTNNAEIDVIGNDVDFEQRQNQISGAREATVEVEDYQEEEEEERGREGGGGSSGEWGCEGECRTFLRVCLSHMQVGLLSSVLPFAIKKKKT